MTVGVLTLRLRLPDNHSLKGKRGVIKSLLARLKSRYEVAAAEVGENDRWQIAELGVACVSNAAPHAREILEHVVSFIESERLEVELLDHEIELITI